MTRHLASLFSGVLGTVLAFSHAAEAQHANGDLPLATIRAAVTAGCESPRPKLAAVAEQIADSAAGIALERIRVGRDDGGWRMSFSLSPLGLLEITRYAPGGRLRRVVVDYAALVEGELRPSLTVTTGADCRIVTGRRVRYGPYGRAQAVELLDGDFAPTGATELLNPPVPPAGADLPFGPPGPVTVALVDTGVNYLLPEIAAALARGADGRALGYDYWDLDPLPFDSDTTRSPYFPERHGTRIASLLLSEAPGIRLVPYRLPRRDLTRMADLVADAAAKRVDILLLTFGSDDAAAWRPFAIAAAGQPDLLVVVAAGDQGRDIDAEPRYPAALPLGNMLVVSSANAAGEPAASANRGLGTVHLLAPGENMRVTDFDGTEARASGSTFAAARIAALAARLKRAHPDWRARELKRAIFIRARPVERAATPPVSRGLIADPAAD